jgi:subtilisin family serine protease
LVRLDPAKIVLHARLRAPVVNDQVLVTLRPGVSERDFEKALADLRAPMRVVGRIPSLNMLQLEVPAERLAEAQQQLAAQAQVASAGLNFVYSELRTVNDPALAPGNPRGWSLRRINAPEAWDVTTGSALIAVVDSGSKVDHEELAGKVVAPFSYATGSEQMLDARYFGPQGEPRFALGHGTHVAVTAAGARDNGRGTAGVSPDSPVMPVQALYYIPAANDVTGSTADIVDGIARALGAGAKVINLSLGSNRADLAREFQAADAARQRQIVQEALPALNAELDGYRAVLDQARASGAIVVKAAGNDALPALFDALCLSRRVISVAASDENDERARFSNYGEYTLVSAPGTRIFSGYSDPATPYRVMSGTSMAAAHVTGVVALMKSLDPELTFEEVRDILVATGQPLNTDVPIGPRVNARAALDEVVRRLQREAPSPPPDRPPTPAPPLDDEPDKPPPPPKSDPGMPLAPPKSDPGMPPAPSKSFR